MVICDTATTKTYTEWIVDSVRCVKETDLKLETLNSRNVFPPHNSPVVFEESTKENCRLYVPRGQMENYKRHVEWSEFKNVVEY